MLITADGKFQSLASQLEHSHVLVENSSMRAELVLMLNGFYQRIPE